MAVSLIDGFVLRPHLALLSDVITAALEEVERGNDQRLIVEMPPRTGKTTLGTLTTGAWVLARHPSWPLALVSHDGRLATSWGRQVRRWVEAGALGPHVEIAPDAGAVGAWETTEGGKFLSISTRESFTGRGARVILIDDPVKDFVDAHSAVLRGNLWDWWLSVAQTRLEPPSLVMVTMCMTGDTPVLRPDGSNTPLAELRPGDEIATYDNGSLTTSRVLAWAAQGPDVIFTLTLESGRQVRANARHPFLTVDADGVETWRQMGTLKPGQSIRLVIGESGAESSAGQTTAPRLRRPRASALITTAKPDGLLVTAHRLSILSLDVLRGSRLVTGLPQASLTASPKHRVADVLSAGRFPLTAPPIGEGNCASTTTPVLDTCGASSVTIATSSSNGTSPQSDCEPLPTTWSITTERVASIARTGVEQVYDVQVERTENFIANGLVSHNTRWHEDDFVGRLLSPDYEGDPADWQRVRLPAFAEAGDPLDRAEGVPLLSPLLDEDEDGATSRWENVRRSVGTYTFSAMYQQRPAPAKGAIFDSGWWRFWTRDPAKATEDGRVVHLDPSTLTGGRWLDSWDCAFKDPAAGGLSGASGSAGRASARAGSGSWVVGQRWVRHGARRYLVAQQRDRWSFIDTIAAMERWARQADPLGSPYGHLVHQRLVEDKANGPAIISVLRDKIAGIKPINPTSSKEARARAVTPECESGHVYLPHPSDPGNEWVADLLSELRNFPFDAHDDQVDALTQALTELRDPGIGTITVPGRAPGAARLVGRQRDLARAVRTDSQRRAMR